jgi:hypothetical protein
MLRLHEARRKGEVGRFGFDPATGTAIVTNTGGWVDFIK